MKNILVTGGAGFIGSNFVLEALRPQSNHRTDTNHAPPPPERIVNLDLLTYAGNRENLAVLAQDSRHIFIQGDIGDTDLVGRILREHQIDSIVNFAAESHVDRSIRGSADFIATNILALHRLLESSRAYWQDLPAKEKNQFRFLQVSTDEVYGSLERNDPAFTETNPMMPNSPYAASKAAGDHLLRAWHHTYGMPTLVTNCSNNYGPYQFPEKLIPLMIVNGLAGKALPIYGDGRQRRDWLYVTDHCQAIMRVLQKGQLGETYAIGGNNEQDNIDMVTKICAILDDLRPRADGKSYNSQISFVTDRPGHDRRYGINASKIKNLLGWQPQENLESGLNKTIAWYLHNEDWVGRVTSGAYRQWMATQYEVDGR